MPQGYIFTPGSAYLAPGAAFSASTKDFFFDQGCAPIRFALWQLIWLPQNDTEAQLNWRWFTGSNTVIEEEIAFIRGADSNNPGGPVTLGADFTTFLKGRRAAKQYGMLVNRFRGGGSQMTIHESRITVWYREGYYGDEP